MYKCKCELLAKVNSHINPRRTSQWSSNPAHWNRELFQMPLPAYCLLVSGELAVQWLAPGRTPSSLCCRDWRTTRPLAGGMHARSFALCPSSPQARYSAATPYIPPVAAYNHHESHFLHSETPIYSFNYIRRVRCRQRRRQKLPMVLTGTSKLPQLWQRQRHLLEARTQSSSSPSYSRSPPNSKTCSY